MVGLNEAQQAAVEHGDGPLLVLAGAGSGKTRVITHRIARLVKDLGIPPERIMAVSFTNKAAEEMAERMAPLVGKDRAKKLWLSTFHSFGVRFLGEESAALIGKGASGRSKFVIFDQSDALGLIREIVRREGLGDRKLDLWAVLGRISLWKNELIEPEDVKATEIEYDVIAKAAYPLYQSALRSMRAFDFDDLVVAPVRILQQNEIIRGKWRERFRYLLIDEFQDTNTCQFELVRLLANERLNVTVVGDDDQSIYGWRGARVENILDFDKKFPGTRLVKLEENYRSVAPILDIANAAMSYSNQRRLGKTLRATKLGGDKVKVCAVGDADQEARFVAKEIRRLRRDEGIRSGDVAVLYRSNLQAKVIESELRVEGLPYQLYGGTQLFDRKQVKDAIAYLRCVVHEDDELSLRRIVNYPTRGIGDTTVSRIERWALAKDYTFAQAVFLADRIPDLPEAARKGARDLGLAIAEARERFDTGRDLSAAALSLLERVGMRRDLEQSNDKEAQKRWLDVEFLLRALDRYEKTEETARPSLATFLQRMTLRFAEEDEPSGEAVTLCTLHGSKGLEWPVVFLIGLNEGILPHTRTTDPKVSEAAPTDVEEERRLFYVGVTRAQKLLYMCRPTRREMRGKWIQMTPSRFLSGLPEQAMESIEHDDKAPVDPDEAVDLANTLLARLRGG